MGKSLLPTATKEGDTMENDADEKVLSFFKGEGFAHPFVTHF